METKKATKARGTVNGFVSDFYPAVLMDFTIMR
jgi:hypothetical protein